MKKLDKIAVAIIDEFGGPVAVGRMFNINSHSVSEWKHNGVPKARMKYLEDMYPKKVKPILKGKK